MLIKWIAWFELLGEHLAGRSWYSIESSWYKMKGRSEVFLWLRVGLIRVNTPLNEVMYIFAGFPAFTVAEPWMFTFKLNWTESKFMFDISVYIVEGVVRCSLPLSFQPYLPLIYTFYILYIFIILITKVLTDGIFWFLPFWSLFVILCTLILYKFWFIFMIITLD